VKAQFLERAVRLNDLYVTIVCALALT